MLIIIKKVALKTVSITAIEKKHRKNLNFQEINHI